MSSNGDPAVSVVVAEDVAVVAEDVAVVAEDVAVVAEDAAVVTEDAVVVVASDDNDNDMQATVHSVAKCKRKH
jgi:hypothetical protein